MIEAFLKRLLSVLFLGSSFLTLLFPISTGGTMEHFHSYGRSLCGGRVRASGAPPMTRDTRRPGTMVQ